MMTIKLLPEHRELIDQFIRSGKYQNPSQVIACGLEALRSLDEFPIDDELDLIFGPFDRARAAAKESKAAAEEPKAVPSNTRPN